MTTKLPENLLEKVRKLPSAGMGYYNVTLKLKSGKLVEYSLIHVDSLVQGSREHIKPEEIEDIY